LNYPQDQNMIGIESLLQQVKALTQAQIAVFKALNDLMCLQEQMELALLHLQQNISNWPYVKVPTK
jgi:hypothetical protein